MPFTDSTMYLLYLFSCFQAQAMGINKKKYLWQLLRKLGLVHILMKYVMYERNWLVSM